MSRELRIVLIVFGSLAGLIVIAIVALLLLLPQFAKHMVSTQSDSAAVTRTAAKIAHLDLPHGYRYSNAFDMLLTTVVEIVPIDPKRRGFFIQLQSINIPRGASDAQSRATLLSGIEGGLRTSGRCQPFERIGADSAVVHGTPIELQVFTCRRADTELRAEIGAFSAQSPNAIVVAIGPQDRFDREALHALLRSVR